MWFLFVRAVGRTRGTASCTPRITRCGFFWIKAMLQKVRHIIWHSWVAAFSCLLADLMGLQKYSTLSWRRTVLEQHFCSLVVCTVQEKRQVKTNFR